jgi:hypothetical protein
MPLEKLRNSELMKLAYRDCERLVGPRVVTLSTLA